MREVISRETRLITRLRFLATRQSFINLKFSIKIAPQTLEKKIII
jgi:hypothetical protein